MSEVLTARLTTEIEKGLKLVARIEQLDKSAVLRRLLSDSLAEWKKERALKLYKEGIFSIEQAARFAGLSLWSFFDVLRQKKIPVSYDSEEFEKELKTLKWMQ